MIVGGLYKFECTAAVTVNGRMALYLGEDFIHRDDGVTVENHKVLLVGESGPTIIDRGLLKHMSPIAREQE